ncbi:MAG: hypothetical protein E6J55_25655 [Deltaproteobacteria bacterium]|nr:MAG: hypothetical protein E6J55_25655 [Deltaproteobacteria bacterium]
MKAKNAPSPMTDRLYATSHLVTTILAGIVTGFYLSHTLVLGRMFSWLAEPSRLSLLNQTYSEFRVLHPPLLYIAVICIQQVAALAFSILSVLLRRQAFPAAAAAVCTLVVPLIHVASGFFRLEVGVVSGAVRDSAQLSRFGAWNVPIHLFHTAATLAAFIILCRINPVASRAVAV